MKIKTDKLKRISLVVLAFMYAFAAEAQIRTKDIADEVESEVSDAKPILQLICTLGIVIALIVGGFKFQSDNSEKPKVIGVTLGVVIIFGIALYAINTI